MNTPSAKKRIQQNEKRRLRTARCAARKAAA
jgi:ribosomal protein S20